MASHMQNLRSNTNAYICKTEIDLQLQEQISGYQWGNEGKGTNQGYGIKRYKLPYTKQISNKDTMYSTENHSKYLVITLMEYNL